MWEHLLQIVLSDHLGGYTFEPQKGEPGYARILTPDRGRTRPGRLRLRADLQRQAVEGVLRHHRQARDAGRPSSPRRKRAARTTDGLRHDRRGDEGRSTAFWLEALEKGDIPVQRMNSLDDIVADPHLDAIGYLQLVDHPSEGRIRMLAVPSEWSESKPEYRRPAPRLGEHTREVLHEAGLSEQKIASLLEAGVAKQAPL
jgi:crotonobetainyl-CoA:carnitine CoA-transferase CaiB-like acyl-CoA transferase